MGCEESMNWVLLNPENAFILNGLDGYCSHKYEIIQDHNSKERSKFCNKRFNGPNIFLTFGQGIFYPTGTTKCHQDSISFYV